MNQKVVAVCSCLVLAGSAHADVRLRANGISGHDQNALLHRDGTLGAASKTSQSGTGLMQESSAVSSGASAFKRFKASLHPWIHPLSASAVVTTVALQMSGLPSTLEIRKDRDVKRYDGYPYFAVLMGATQWCIYGSYAAYTSHDYNFLTMVAANGPGVFLGTFYITTFFRFVPTEDARNAALKRFLLVGLCLLIAEATACIVMGHAAVFYLGLLGAIGSAQIAISPFKTLPEVIRTRSTRSWPLDLCVWNLIQSWFTGGFGFANDDPWVWVPNVIGVIAAIIQLTFIALYWERPFGPRGTCVKLKAAAALA